MTTFSQIRALAGFTFLLAFALSAKFQRSAFAALAPIKPPTCPATTNLAWNYRVGGPAMVFDLPSDPNCSTYAAGPCPHYINKLTHTREFVSNSWVGYVAFRIGSFWTESGFDKLYWGLDGYSPSNISGTAAAGSLLAVNTGWSFGATKAFLWYYADSTHTEPGFAIDQVQVCTYLSSVDTHPPVTLASKRRTIGTLLGTDDVVYLQFPASSANHYPITMWKDVSDGTGDFDIIGRCNALPTTTVKDWSSTFSSNQESFDVQGCNGTVYLAVFSFSGSGVFSVVRGIHSPSNHTNLRVGTKTVVSSGKYAAIGAATALGARRLYAQTEGEQYIGQIDTWNSGACGATSCGGAKCDICYDDVPGRCVASGCGAGSWVEAKQDCLDPKVVAHELGHLKYCLADEYYNPPPLPDGGASGPSVYLCEHSNMSNPWSDNNNFCVAFDHEYDGQSGMSTGVVSSMQQAATAGRAIESHNITFDNFDYYSGGSWDWHSKVGSLVVH